MPALGGEVQYEYLVGVSRLAYRMQLSKGGFCPRSPVSGSIPRREAERTVSEIHLLSS